MPTDALSASLAEQMAGHLTSGRWTVLAVAGGPALTDAKKFLRGFEIESTDRTVVIICEREAK